MNHTAVINVVGLSQNLLPFAPYLSKFAANGSLTNIHAVTPAVTCTAQSTYLTGLPPSGHGSVANGWYFKDLSQIWLWRQSNKLIAGEKIWETARKIDQNFTCANMFWWYNMYSSVDFSATPRPMYPADGRKIPDIYTFPANLRDELNDCLGQFPLFNFWGPKANIVSSKWIAKASRHIFEKHRPTLNLIYLPHLDYNLQRLGPRNPQIAKDVAEIDEVCRELIEYFLGKNCKVIVLSEYAIHEVDSCVHINRILREKKWLCVREELGKEILDPGASQAFAVADHQIAHVYIHNDGNIAEIKNHLQQFSDIEFVLDKKEQQKYNIDHSRSGDLVLLSSENSWFSYYYWLDDNKAPDFARTVDIHRKPGYDPVELFVDPKIYFPTLKVVYKLLRKKLGFRYLLDIISLDASLVKGSHGRVTKNNQPLFISSEKQAISQQEIAAEQVKENILTHIFGEKYHEKLCNQ
ncbi:alkaline phosphatase family protein [Candidatus Uabimicrobium amorphum]|uniref:Alkaline phosphatase family protein n=1 Tax=Uabimicrobium amorphum TaxID=2596890 RepID=A0A5S9IK12_UABAM|nr:nucleotide pyrophosphatase/phosphodiesterase family protein [Candidatus Uabimicrobium amorphum]BBM83273.1 alkaline phosphatase family protein [Candidatus Uabimicrobium amorphum]